MHFFFKLCINLNTANTNQHLSTKLCDINNLNSLPPSVSNFAAMASLKKGTNTCTSIEKDYIYVDS